ncbi:MAG: glutamyl-tRNA reductase [Anaerotruncus sp.]|nr:glutamyl-tRNA reductase [Anaerotruncus sp.]
MKIQMVGIDYQKAGIQLRERFSMTQAAIAEQLKHLPPNTGCVILSTCNRTELWVSGEADPFALLCRMKGLDGAPYTEAFVRRSGETAAEHLFALACGLKSQVFGEDQIITQVGNALALAREAGGADAVLEMLFRAAVTAAKEVKTNVRLTGTDRSVAARAASFLEERCGSLAGKRALVIGNGEMGRLAAKLLVQRGCRVQMTLRSYRHGEVLLPTGVETVPYEQRLDWLAAADLVLSATTSPHYTLRAKELPKLQKPVLFCDLAVPRDIDPQIALLEHASVFDTDTICGGEVQTPPIPQQAQEILQERLAQFCRWYAFRPFVPRINALSQRASQDFLGRTVRSLRRLPLAHEQQQALAAQMQQAAQKSAAKLLFGLRENLEPELWETCISALEKSAQEVQ